MDCHFLLQGYSQPRDQACISYPAGRFFATEPLGKHLLHFHIPEGGSLGLAEINSHALTTKGWREEDIPLLQPSACEYEAQWFSRMAHKAGASPQIGRRDWNLGPQLIRANVLYS